MIFAPGWRGRCTGRSIRRGLVGDRDFHRTCPRQPAASGSVRIWAAQNAWRHFRRSRDRAEGIHDRITAAGAVTVILAWLLAHLRGARADEVLALRRIELGIGGWIAIVAGFLAVLYLLIIAVTQLLGIDTSQSQGLVEKAMRVLPAIGSIRSSWPVLRLPPPIRGADVPGADFRGLVADSAWHFGAAVPTSLVWSLIHITEPWYAVGLIFVMGLILSFLLVRFGSLWVTFVCHAVWNGIYSLALLALPQT